MPAPRDNGLARQAAELDTLMAVPARLRIVRALLDGERSFEELRVRADVPAAELLPHLNLMCQAGVLVWRHQPCQVLYSLTAQSLGLLARGLAGRGRDDLYFWVGLLPSRGGPGRHLSQP